MKIFLIICTVALYGALLGCDNLLTRRTKSSDSKAVAATPIVAAPKAALPLQGDWDSGCQSEGAQGEFSQRIVLKVTGADLLTTVQLFSDSACKTVSTTSKTNGKIKVGSLSKAVVGAYEVDIETVSGQVTPASEASVQSMKTGLSESIDPKCRALGDTLKVNVPADFLPCAPSLQEFTIFQVLDNKLRFGDCETAAELCKTAAARAVDLRIFGAFARQGQ